MEDSNIDSITTAQPKTQRSAWYLFALVAIFIGSLFGYKQYDNFKLTEENELARLQTLARIVDANLAIHLRAMDKALLYVRDKQLIQAQKDPSRPAVSLDVDEMRFIVETTAGVRTLAVVDAEGKFLVSNRPELIGKDFSQRPYFISARQTRDPKLLIVSEPFTTSLNVFALNLSRPILGPDGEFLGAVVLTLDPEFFRSMLSSALYADDLRCLLIHQDGLVFEAVGDPSVRPGLNLAKPGSLLSIHQSAGQRESLVKAASFSTGDQRMGAFRNVILDDVQMDKILVLSFTRNVEQLLADWKKASIAISIAYLIFLLLGGGWLAFHQRQRLKLQQERQVSIEAKASAIAAQRSLVDSQEMLSRAQSVGHIGSFAMERDSDRFTYTLETARLFDLNPDGKCTFDEWFSRVHPDDQTAVQTAWQAALQGASYDMTYRIIVREEVRWIQALAELNFDAQGNLLSAIGTVQDISDRRLVEQKLASSEAFSTLIVDTVPEVILVVDAGGLIIRVNSQLEKVFGYSQGEMIGQSVEHLMPTRFRSRHPEYRHAYSKENLPRMMGQNRELFGLHKNGREIPVEVGLAPLTLHDKNYVIVSIADISLRQTALNALRESEMRFRLLTECVKDYAIIMLSLKGEVLTWNEGAQRLKGYRSEEIIGQPMSRFYTAEDIAADKPFRLLEQSKRNGTVEDEGWRVRKDGVLFYADMILTALTDTSGELVGFAKITRDITERRKVEAALTESKNRLEAAASAGIVGIWDWDVRNNRLVWDRVMYQLYGIHEADFSGAYEAWASAIHPEDKAYVTAEIQAALHGEREYAPEFRIIWPDGSIRYIKSASHTTFDSDGKPQRMIGVNYDQTAQKKIEADLIEARKQAEAVSESKSEFLANMSHEIRTPMNAVMGLAELLLNTDLNPRQRDFLMKLNNSARSLLGILNDILDYSKIEAGRLELESVDFTLPDILEHTAGLFHIAAEEKGLELIFAVDPSIPPVLIGDPLRFKQILNNLIGNAIKFTRQGHVHLAMNRLEQPGEKITLQVVVEDSGIGMSAEQVSRLFQPFEQADTSVTRKFGGTGLGLTIAKTLVEMMGGQITVKSEPDQGSTFTFTVDLGISGTPAKERTAANLRGMRTLIVDDHPVSCCVLEQMISAWSFKADIAGTGEEGLEKALAALQQGQPYELILVDWKLPGVDGIEMARRLRQAENLGKPGTRHAIVVMVTAFGRQVAEKAVQDVEFDAILDKPVIPSQLFDVVADLQEGGVSQQSLSQWSDLQQARQRVQSIQGHHLLLVEDNLTNQMVARELLEQLGFNVSVANDGHEGIQMASNSNYHAILMDLHMPKVGGVEATQRLRALPQCQNVPIIAMTAAASPADREACKQAGMNDFLPKPIDINELSTVLLTWIQPSAEVVATSRPAVPQSAAFEVPGLSLIEAVRRMGGNWGLLRRSVEQFSRDFSGSSSELDTYISAPSYSDARRLVHTIKGVALSIGANELHAVAENLEAELAVNQLGPLERFKFELAKTIAVIDALPPNEAVVMPLTNSARRNEILREIRDAVSRSEFVTFDLLNELMQSLEGEQLPLGRNLQSELAAFKFEAAKGTLNSLAVLCDLQIEA